jgi:hypothetical protein
LLHKFTYPLNLADLDIEIEEVMFSADAATMGAPAAAMLPVNSAVRLMKSLRDDPVMMILFPFIFF